MPALPASTRPGNSVRRNSIAFSPVQWQGTTRPGLISRSAAAVEIKRSRSARSK